MEFSLVGLVGHTVSQQSTLFTANISLPIKLAQQWVEFPPDREFPTSCWAMKT